MDFNELIKAKKASSSTIKREYKLLLKNPALGIIMLENKALLQKLYFGLSTLPINFIIVGDFGKQGRDEQFKNIYITKDIKDVDMLACDFAVLSSNVTNIGVYLENGVVPITPKQNHLAPILKEYIPMKSEGNAYLYDESNEWSIFHAITRYLENYKITFDNKNLVKNVFEQ